MSIGRQCLDGFLLLSFGAGAFIFLSWLPQKLDAMVVVSEAIADLIRGLSQLLEAALGLTAVILIALLLVLAIVAIVAGTNRLFRGCNRLMRKAANQQIRTNRSRSRIRR
ncbi:Uncharacterized conserved membrane protein [Synechococcus sp. WH 7803]|nr:Uncharacterized conserved membrane protein [Synechococcus sp. WH 7803]